MRQVHDCIVDHAEEKCNTAPIKGKVQKGKILYEVSLTFENVIAEALVT